MSSLASLAARSAFACSLGFVPVLLAACGGTVTVVKGDGECVTKLGTFDVGEQFSPDGCNTCTCEADGGLSCTEMACNECSGPVPPCAPPSDPGCVIESTCVDGNWTCDEICDDCAGAPPIDCLAPNDCYYTGPFCAGDHYECGELICEKGGCDGPVPECPPPFDPNCFSYPDCYGEGWFCVTECDKPKGSCEEQYPSGVELVWYLVTLQCGCVMGEVCSDVCQDTCNDPGPDGGECEVCIQDAANSGEQCVYDAAFGDECQNDFECSSYIECVVNG